MTVKFSPGVKSFVAVTTPKLLLTVRSVHHPNVLFHQPFLDYLVAILALSLGLSLVLGKVVPSKTRKGFELILAYLASKSLATCFDVYFVRADVLCGVATLFANHLRHMDGVDVGNQRSLSLLPYVAAGNGATKLVKLVLVDVFIMIQPSSVFDSCQRAPNYATFASLSHCVQCRCGLEA